jgi:SulP family sulfate permease
VTSPAPGAGRAALLDRLVPARRWLRTYSRGDVVADLRAGATVGVLVVPQAMAYAALAGVSPIAGLYAAVASLVVYAVVGTSRYISVGPVAIDSLLTAAAVAPLADGDTARYAALASLMAIIVGVLQVGAGLARLGALVNLISVPVVTGFTSAAALTIALSQVPALRGLDAGRSGTSFVDAVRSVVPALDTISLATTVAAVVAVGGLVLLKKVAPAVPGPLVVVAALTTVVWVGGMDSIAVVGDVPSGLPTPSMPDVGWADVSALLPAAAAIALVSYMESISTGTVFARRTGTRVEPDQELVAVGLANTAAGFVRGFPVAGGFSRGAVNFNAGARSPMSGVVAAVLVSVALLVATPVLAHLPRVALAAVIVVAVAGLVDIGGALDVARIRRSDLVTLLVTALATLVLGPAQGLGVGVALSLALFLRHAARPHMPELGRRTSDGAFRNVRRHDVVTSPETVVFRVDAPLSFAGARPVAERVDELVAGRDDVRYVVIDCSAVNAVDFTGADMLRALAVDLGARGVELHLAALRGPVQDVLERTEFFRDLEAGGRVHGTVPGAVDSLPVRVD